MRGIRGFLAVLAREYGTLMLIFAIGAAAGFIAWLATSPSPGGLPCGTGRAASTCYGPGWYYKGIVTGRMPLRDDTGQPVTIS